MGLSRVYLEFAPQKYTFAIWPIKAIVACFTLLVVRFCYLRTFLYFAADTFARLVGDEHCEDFATNFQN